MVFPSHISPWQSFHESWRDQWSHAGSWHTPSQGHTKTPLPPTCMPVPLSLNNVPISHLTLTIFPRILKGSVKSCWQLAYPIPRPTPEPKAMGHGLPLKENCNFHNFCMNINNWIIILKSLTLFKGSIIHFQVLQISSEDCFWQKKNTWKFPISLPFLKGKSTPKLNHF